MGSRDGAAAPRVSERTAFVGGCLASVLGGLGLLGWATGVRAFASLSPWSIPMVPGMALGIFVFGGSVVLEARAQTPRLTRALILLVALFAAAQLAVSLAGLPPWVDALSVPEPEMFGAIPIGRTSALTALGLLVACLSLWFTNAVGLAAHAAGAGLALGVHLLGMVVTLGYLFGAPLLYGGPILPVAFSTGMALASVGAALMGLARKESALLRPFVGPSAQARLLRGLLPVIPAIVVGQLLFARVRGLNPALHAALTAVSSALVTAGAVAWAARGVGRTLERAQADRERSHRDADRLSRLYMALSQVNQAVVRTRTRDDLFRSICQVLVGAGFRMAWVGWQSSETCQLVPVAQCGDETGYLQSIEISTNADRPEGRGPSGTAFRENHAFVCNDALNDAATAPWRGALERWQLRASAAFPIRTGGRVRGTLTVYADEAGFFQDKEVALLTEVADDVSFALDNLAGDEARRLAEAEAQREKLLSDTMIESMPGIVYLYDDQGRFLRWNRNFESVSGYSRGEIARMPPLAFFPDVERERLQARIAEVFEKGQSSIEATFLAKDGARTPYVFTGNRVVLDGRPCLVGVGIDISERQRAEEARQASEALYRTLFQHAPDGLVIADAESYYLDANESMCQMLGYPRDEFVGLHASHIVVDTEQGQIEGALADVKTRTRHHREWTFRRKDGSTFLAEVIAAMMPDGNLLGMIRDVTDRKSAESALREAELRFHTLFEQTPVGVVVVDPATSSIVEGNAQAAWQLGYAATELPGLELSEIEALEAREETRGRIDQLFVEGRNEFETRQRTKSGEVRDVYVSGQMIELGGRKVLHCVFLDITERKQAEKALRELNDTLELRVTARTEELRVALVRAEAADRIKSAFLATMSHELRTPLNSIIGFTGVILQGLAGPLNPEQTKQLGMVRTSARHLLELINDVLDLSKIEAGQLEVRAEAFDLRDSLARVTASVMPLAEKKGLELTLHAGPGLGEMSSDRRRVEQILLNLLGNAIKFTPSGRVTLTAELMVGDSASAAGAPRPCLSLRVADTGMGIHSSDLESLFQPFRQIDSGLTRQHEGTGLGLAICRRLATLLGGEISATSEWSKGTVFTVTLPLQAGADS